MSAASYRTSVHDLVFVLFKRKWSLILISLTGILAMALWLFCIRDDAYTATAKVLVKLGQEQAPPPTVVGSAPLVIGYRSQDLNSEVEILQNTELIAKVVDEIGLDKPIPIPPPKPGLVPLVRFKVKSIYRAIGDYVDETLIRFGLRERISHRDKAIAQVKAGLKVKSERDSNVFTAQMTLADREGSAFVLNRVLMHYMEFRPKIFESKGLQFFQSGVDRATAELATADEAMRRFESEGDISLLHEQQAQLVKQIAEAQAALKEAEVAKNVAESRVQRLDRELAGNEPNYAALGEYDRESLPNSLLRQIAQLQQEREALRMTQLDTGERVLNNRQQFRVLAEMLAANLRSVLAEKSATYDLRKQAYDGLREDLAQLHNKQTEWMTLRRTSAAVEENLAFYRRKLQDASAASAMERQRIGNVTIIEPAVAPSQPSGMRKTMLLGLAALLAVAAALVWVCILEIFDHGVYRREALEARLGVPVYAVLPFQWLGRRLYERVFRRRYAVGA
jgi:uncharacterized protein involved in exopolysaccharide biosynthesis